MFSYTLGDSAQATVDALHQQHWRTLATLQQAKRGFLHKEIASGLQKNELSNQIRCVFHSYKNKYHGAIII